jgi:hypothetical protein
MKQECKCGFATDLQQEMKAHLTNRPATCGLKGLCPKRNIEFECGFCDVEPLDERFLWKHLQVVHGEMPGLIPPIHYKVEEYVNPQGALLYKKITREEQ